MGNEEEKEFECDACGEMKPNAGSEVIIVYVHRIEGRGVGVDREQICGDCVERVNER